MGRNKEYRNAAEKQKAYRERKKQLDTMLSHIEKRTDALRYVINSYTKQGRSARVSIHRNHAGSRDLEPFTQIMVDGNFVGVVNSLVAQYLINTGELVYSGKDFSCDFYTLQEQETE